MRLATFNLHHAAPPGRWFARNVAAASACASLDADVVALQEVEVCSPRSWCVDQPARIAAACDAVAWFVPNWTRMWGRFGNAVIVRGKVLERRVVDLPTSAAAHPRRALVARVELRDGAPLTVVATHLSERGRGPDGTPEAVHQLRTLLDAVAGEPTPRVLLGDLNLGPDRAERILASHGFGWAPVVPTYPAAAPRTAIDWIAADGLVLSAAHRPIVAISDHRPLVVDAVRSER